MARLNNTIQVRVNTKDKKAYYNKCKKLGVFPATTLVRLMIAFVREEVNLTELSK